MSLVVPGILVTIAFSSSIKEFKRLLLPTLGNPIIPTFIPSFTTLLSSDFFIMSINLSLKDIVLGSTFSFVISSISSYSG